MWSGLTGEEFIGVSDYLVTIGEESVGVSDDQ
jgi:hypothetical protein